MMHLLAAQLPDPASSQSIGWLALALFALFGGINQVLKFFDRFKADPPLHKEYVSKTDHDIFRRETSDELKRHAARRAEIYEAQRLHGERLVRIETETEKQTEAITAMREELTDVQKRVDVIPDRTVNQLLAAQKLLAK